jgi:pilus assembly protein Flp/PilA
MVHIRAKIRDFAVASALHTFVCDTRPGRGPNAKGHLMKNLLNAFKKDTSGATAIEYGLIAALIAVTLIFSLTTLGQAMSKNNDKTSTEVASAR